MKKMILLLLVIFTATNAGEILSIEPSPITGYERLLTKEAKVYYQQQNGTHRFSAVRLLDLDNIYHQGSVDNYDDPYIAEILKKNKPFKTITAKDPKAAIDIVFNSMQQAEGFDLKLFKEQNLTIHLYLLNSEKLTMPLNLRVYPFFVIKSRFVQGVITPNLLKSLIEESDYTKPKKQITLKQLQAKLERIFPNILPTVSINYDKSIELFIVKNQTGKLVSYISKEGRYILEYPKQ